MSTITREAAVMLLKKYNKDPFHIQHAYTVEAVMKWFSDKLGYSGEAEYWGIVRLRQHKADVHPGGQKDVRKQGGIL